MIKHYRSINKRGFTLIELLVVIAIIGILSSVVLASLRQSNQRATDAKIKSQLKAMIGAAQLYYDTTGNNSWNSVCIVEPMDSMKKSAGAVGPAGSCQGSGQIGWRAAAPLVIQDQYSTSPASGPDYACVDYTAASKICDTLPSGTYSSGVYLCESSICK